MSDTLSDATYYDRIPRTDCWGDPLPEKLRLSPFYTQDVRDAHNYGYEFTPLSAEQSSVIQKELETTLREAGYRMTFTWREAGPAHVPNADGHGYEKVETLLPGGFLVEAESTKRVFGKKLDSMRLEKALRKTCESCRIGALDMQRTPEGLWMSRASFDRILSKIDAQHRYAVEERYLDSSLLSFGSSFDYYAFGHSGRRTLD